MRYLKTRFQVFGSDKEPKINLQGCRDTTQRDDEESMKLICTVADEDMEKVSDDQGSTMQVV